MGMADASPQAVALAEPAARTHRGTDRRLLYVAASLLLVLPLAFAFYWPAGHGLDVTGHPIGRDFINVWSGPQVAFGGRISTLFDLRGYHAAIGDLFGQPLPFHNWGYPLFVLPAFWPLAQLPYFVALAVWTFGLFAVFAAVTVFELPQADRWPAVVVLALAPACLINEIGGQNGFLSGALLLGGILSLDRRPLLAGVLFGLLTYKPHLGFVVPFVLLALGAWRTIAAATITAALLYGLSALVFGIEPWRQYFEITGAFQWDLLRRFQGFYVHMMISGVSALRLMKVPFEVAMAVQIGLALLVLALTCWAVRQTADPCRRAFVVACAAPLVTPYAFNYDLTVVAAALVWVLFGRLPWRAGGTLVYLIAWLTPLGVMYFSFIGIGFAPLAILALFIFAVAEAAWGPARDQLALT